MTYRLTPLSVDDLDQIGTYVSERSRRSAFKLIVSFERQFELLAERPRIGRARPELRAELRSGPHRTYVILYRAIAGGVEIVRVVHGARDLAAVLAEQPAGQPARDED